MKKKVFLGLLIFIGLFTITGCGSRKLKSENDLKKYLKKYYPNEAFTIVSYSEIDVEGDVGGCDSPGKGASYQIKSEDSGIVFTIKDDYHFNSFTCEYVIKDEYLEKAKEKFISENTSSKMENYHACYQCLGISFKREKYLSDEEMINDIWNIIEKLKNTYPFKHQYVESNIYVSIGNSNGSESYDFKDISSIEKVKEIVEAL